MEQLPVFFNQKMGVDVLETPSPRKPLEVVAQWIERYPVDVRDFPPATVDDFYLAHQREHVDGVIGLRIPNGMDTRDQKVVDSLYWTTGSMIAASKHALKHRISVSPTSGFHHAGYDFSWGFAPSTDC